MIDAFCGVYGEYLEKCDYAVLKGIPIQFKNFYSIIQIPIYGNCIHPEVIEIKVEESLSFYKNTDVYKEVEQYIIQNTNHCKLCVNYRGIVIPL
jgi:hypothetical protein